MPSSLDPDTLSGLAQNIVPSTGVREVLRRRIDRRIRSRLQDADLPAVSPAFRRRVFTSLQQRIASFPGDLLRTTSQQVAIAHDRRSFMREALFARLSPMRHVFVHTSIKWTSAVAVFLLLVRFALPLAFLAPQLEAESAVQMVPEGPVTLLIGGLAFSVNTPHILHGPTLITTHGAPATLLLNDLVIRMNPGTTARLNVSSESPQPATLGSTISLIGKGSLWVLGIVPPIIPGIGVETAYGTVEVGRGSVAIEQTESHVTVSSYDRGVVFDSHGKTIGLSSGESVVADATRIHPIRTLPLSAFQKPWAKEQLAKDANYRREIASLQEERRQQLAGILPTSSFYPIKRLAEEVDVFFTLNSDVKAQKRITFADTRFSEAVTLLKEGDTDAAILPLTEYRQTLLELATSTEDNIVKFLVNQQIADSVASVDFTSPDAGIATLKEAVLAVVKDVPNTATLEPQDLQAYTLVDALEAQYHTLTAGGDPKEFAYRYAKLDPYITTTLKTTSVSPLLQKELLARLVSVSSLLKKYTATNPNDSVVALQQSIESYLPSEPEQRVIQATQAELDARVAAMVARVLTFRMPVSRANQLNLELAGLQNDPDRGTLLRRFAHALPQGLAPTVDAEIVQLSSELQGKGTQL